MMPGRTMAHANRTMYIRCTCGGVICLYVDVVQILLAAWVAAWRPDEGWAYGACCASMLYSL